MKQILFIVLAFISVNVMAQEQKNEIKVYELNKKHRAAQDFSPEQMATIKSKKMALEFDLSDEQQQQVKGLFLKQTKTREIQKENLKKHLETAKKNNLSKEERYKMLNSQLDNKLDMKAEMKAILTEGQYEKWNNVNSMMDKKKLKMRQERKAKQLEKN